MSKTIVSLFPSAAEAQLVKQKLVEAGYSSDTVRIVTNQERSAAAVAGGSTSTSPESGLGATISNFFKSLTGGDETEQGDYADGLRHGGALVSVTVADGREQEVADWLESYGGQDVADQSVAGTTTSGKAIAEGGSVPIVQEEMTVGKKLVQRGGVRVYSHLVETPVEEAIQLREERVQVDRRPVNRAATEADFGAFKEGTIELTETAEEAVVSKSARVVEEIVVGKTTSQTTETIRDRVRHTEVEVEHLGAKAAGSNADDDFRGHFAANYAGTGNTYDAYAPAYQYGHTLATDPRYQSSNWSDVEASAQTDWDSRGTGKWENFKAAVQQGWSKTREAVVAPRK